VYGLASQLLAHHCDVVGYYDATQVEEGLLQVLGIWERVIDGFCLSQLLEPSKCHRRWYSCRHALCQLRFSIPAYHDLNGATSSRRRHECPPFVT
jgi:hypothetical protein